VGRAWLAYIEREHSRQGNPRESAGEAFGIRPRPIGQALGNTSAPSATERLWARAPGRRAPCLEANVRASPPTWPLMTWIDLQRPPGRRSESGSAPGVSQL